MNKKSGFTLLEMITVIAILSIALPSFFAIFLTVIRQQTRIVALQQAKNQGDSALSTIDFLLRNSAVSIHSLSSVSDVPTEANQKCFLTADPIYPVAPVPTDGTYFFFRDRYSEVFRIYQTGGRIASDSSIFAASSDITIAPITITNFRISCEVKSDFSSPIVSIEYQVNYNFPNPADVVRLNYRTKIKLRTQQ